MKKIYSLLFVLLAAVTGYAQTVNTADITPETIDGGITWTVGDVTFKALKVGNGTAPTRNGKALDIRLYANNTLEVTSADKNLTKLVFTISSQGLKRLTAITSSTGAIATQAAGDTEVTWTGNASSVTLTVGAKADFGTDGSGSAGQFDFSAITIETGEGTGGETPDPNPGEDPDPAVKEYTLPYTNALTSDNGDFTIVNTLMDESLTYIWTFHSTYGAKASSYKGGAYASEASLVSPLFNLEGLTAATLSFEHAVNFFTGDVPSQVKLLVNVEGSETYDEITIPNWGTNTDYTYVNSGDIDLSAYVGKKIHVIFKYTSTAESAGTWEIKNFSFTATEASSVTPPTITPTGSSYTGSVTVTITPANDDDAIYYTIDGTTPVPGEGTTKPYTAPFELTESATVKAVAEGTDGSLSDIVEKSYTVIQPATVPDGYTYTFNFNAEEREYSTTPAEAGWSYQLSEGTTEEKNAANDLGNVTGLEKDGIVITLPEKAADEDAPSIHARLWKATSNFTLRFYKGQKISFAAPAGKHIAGIVFYGIGSSNIALQDEAETALVVEKAETSGYRAVYAPEVAAETLAFTATATNQLTAIDVILDGEVTGIANAAVLPAAKQAIYDLSGRRVQQAKSGLYIVGGQKVLVK